MKIKKDLKLMSDKQSQTLSEWIVKGMQEKKAKDIVVLDLRGVKQAIADFFVICTGTSDTQIDAIADSIEAEVYKGLGENAWHKEGKQNREWILIDYVNVVAHVFQRSKREHFALEDLWGDAKINHIESLS